MFGDLGASYFHCSFHLPMFEVASLGPRCFLWLALVNHVVPEEQEEKRVLRAVRGLRRGFREIPGALCCLNPSSGPHNRVTTGKFAEAERQRDRIQECHVPQDLVSMVPVFTHSLFSLLLPECFKLIQ